MAVCVRVRINVFRRRLRAKDIARVLTFCHVMSRRTGRDISV